EKAKDGVLFLDEIGDLPMEAQVKLLRFLQDHQFSRLGGRESISVDIQVVSATHQNLEQLIADGKFREDLYYRIKGFQIEVPPLRKRKEDIPLLVTYFLEKLRNAGRTRISAVSEETMSALTRYNWSGNVRELENIIERAMIVANGHEHTRIEIQDLPRDLVQDNSLQAYAKSLGASGTLDISENVARAQLFCVEEALKATKGKKTEAWKLLGLHDRYALTNLMKRIRERYPNLLYEFPIVNRAYCRNKTDK
ncbi:MAG: sigma-54-dependent Fis family transcriptional regulator, partial [Calditrichaeota bacterium]